MMKCACVCVIALVTTSASAAIFPQDKGIWPKTWPQELEALRTTARTIGVGTGLQENIYEIPMKDKETFEKLWPVLMKLRTPGSPITLYRTGKYDHHMWGSILKSEVPTVRIYAPSLGISMKREFDRENPPDIKEWMKKGWALKADAPWPKELHGKNGELPQYVCSVEKDGKLVWEAADPFNNVKKHKGFFNRARIDIELVIDGQVIDLNAFTFPEDAQIIDKRGPLKK